MSAPEAAGLIVAACPADLIELAALRDQDAALAARTGLMPGPLRIGVYAEGFALRVRPERWLLLQPPAPAGSRIESWQEACRGAGTAVELSSALRVLHLSGGAYSEVLKRGCRLDLDEGAFPPGAAAATQIAHAAVIVARLRGGMLLLMPATLAQHFSEWLAEAARGFGMTVRADVTVTALRGDESL